MPRITLAIYQRPKQGSNHIQSYDVMRYRHKIAAIGNHATASCQIPVERSEAERIFRDFIGCRVAAYADNPIIPIWEGYISRISISSGVIQQSKSIDSMFNSVIVQYSIGNGALPEQTAKATDATSIAIYGEKQTTFDAGELYGNNAAFAQAIRDQYQGVRSYPVITPMSGAGGADGVYIEMRGFAETLKWDTFGVTNTAATNIATQILTTTGTSYTNNSGVFYDDTDTGGIITHASAPGNRELGESSWDLMLRIVESGDYAFGISDTNPNTDERRAYFREANRSVEYSIDAYGDGKIFSLLGLEIEPQWVRPDRSIRINNMALTDDDSQEAYITSVEYDAEANRVNWATEENTTLEGVFNFNYFSKPPSVNFGAPRRQSATNDISVDSLTSGELDVDNININGNTIASTNSNGDISLNPTGTGDVLMLGTVNNFQLSEVNVGVNGIDGMTHYASVNRLDLSRTSAAALNTKRQGTDGAVQTFYKGTTNVGSISVTTTNTAYNTTSARSVKDKIKDTNKQDALNRALSVKVRDYEYIKEPGKQRTGFVAEELAEVYPEAVTLDPDDPKSHGVDYGKLTPLLIASLQQLAEQVTALESEIERLKSA